MSDTNICDDGTIDLRSIIYRVCEDNNGRCACKIEGRLAENISRCQERYSVALAVLCAFANAEGRS